MTTRFDDYIWSGGEERFGSFESWERYHMRSEKERRLDNKREYDKYGYDPYYEKKPFEDDPLDAGVAPDPSTYDELESDLEEAMLDLSTMRKTFIQLEKEKTALENENSDHQTRIATLIKENNNLIDTACRRGKERDTLRATVAELKKQVADLEAKNEKLNKFDRNDILDLTHD